MAFGTPLIPVTAANTMAEGALPPRSFLSFGADNIVLLAMKKADTGDSIVVRAFEIQGKYRPSGSPASSSTHQSIITGSLSAEDCRDDQ